MNFRRATLGILFPALGKSQQNLQKKQTGQCGKGLMEEICHLWFVVGWFKRTRSRVLNE
jgi:hypothetical protein